MQRSGDRLAIVLGQDRREQGVIGLRDIIKFIFGEVSS
jgi:CBS domain containing-hemolysin-like protein